MKKLAVFLIAVVSIGAAWAENEPVANNDNTTVTSKAYVDGELSDKQDKLGTNMTEGNVAVYTSNPGTLTQKPVYNGTGTYNSAALVEAGTVNSGIHVYGFFCSKLRLCLSILCDHPY